MAKAALAALAFVGLWAVSAAADVTGAFNLDITLFPEGTQTEAVNYEVDLLSNLQFNSTFSGITAGADLGFGTTGLEFAVLKLTFNLGALTLRDENVFAAPFGCTLFAAPLGNGPDAQLRGACPGNRAVAIGDANGDGRRDDNAVAFVKKRTSIEINVAGITLGNLMIFEDVDFPDIQGGDAFGASDHEHDHFNGRRTYSVYGVNDTVDDQTPSFGMGDVITFSGQTVSGITITSETAICASGRNHIKRRAWDFEVVKSCAPLNIGVLLEGGGNPYLIEAQKLWIEGIGGDGFLLDLFADMRPATQSLFGTIGASYTVADLVGLRGSLHVGPQGAGAVLELRAANAVLVATDANLDLSFESVVGVFSFVLNPEVNPLDLSLRVEADEAGLAGASVSLGFSQAMLRVSTTSRFEPAAGRSGFDWAQTDFGLAGDADWFTFGAAFGFKLSGITETNVVLGFLF